MASQVYDLVDDDCHDVVNLQRQDIDECEDAGTLLAWHSDCREVCDDVIAQVEANKVSELRSDEWTRRATGVLIGLKKKMKRIERRCSALNIDMPDTKDARQRAHINRLEQRILEARAFERNLILEWLRGGFEGDASSIIYAIEDREHVTFYKTQQVAA